MQSRTRVEARPTAWLVNTWVNKLRMMSATLEQLLAKYNA
jgi:hypothetical protein